MPLAVLADQWFVSPEHEGGIADRRSPCQQLFRFDGPRAVRLPKV
jgi:hypothetical protein